QPITATSGAAASTHGDTSPAASTTQPPATAVCTLTFQRPSTVTAPTTRIVTSPAAVTATTHAGADAASSTTSPASTKKTMPAITPVRSERSVTCTSPTRRRTIIATIMAIGSTPATNDTNAPHHGAPSAAPTATGTTALSTQGAPASVIAFAHRAVPPARDCAPSTASAVIRIRLRSSSPLRAA